MIKRQRSVSAAAVLAMALAAGCGGGDDETSEAAGGAGTGGAGTGGASAGGGSTGGGSTGGGNTGGGSTGGGSTGGGSGTTTALTASYDLYVDNVIGQPFDRKQSVSVSNGVGTLETQAYTLGYPTSSASGCSISGGSLGACNDVAPRASLLVLCSSTTASNPDAVLLRTDAQTALAALTPAQLSAVVPAAGMEFRYARCNGSLNADDTVTLNADGSARSFIRENGVVKEDQIIPSSDIAAFFSDVGTISGEGDQRAALRAYKSEVDGAVAYYLLFTASPLPPSTQLGEPAVLVYRP